MARSDEKVRARLDLLEAEAREHPRRHALRLFGLALLGYTYPAMLLIGSLGIAAGVLALAPMIWASSLDQLMILYAFALLAALGLAAAVLRTFWVTLPRPDGQPLRPDEAMPLRRLIDELRAPMGAPQIHEIYVDTHLNAAVMQQPRFGFWGPKTNYLILGLPLLVALDHAMVRAVLAHELAHLRGEHNRFSAWIYRIQQTWESLGRPFTGVGWLRWIVMGWFVRWYGEHFSISTLALRRLHEYDADRRSAGIVGGELMALTLVRIDWWSEQLERRFWPAQLRQAAAQALPPGDVLARIQMFFQLRPSDDALLRWTQRQLVSRTPITSRHPCLADRLEGLGQRQAMDSDAWTTPATESAVALLGDAHQRLWSVINASWKAMVIERWRYEHQAAKRLKEKLEKVEASAATEPLSAERQWERMQLQAEYTEPERAMALLREFLGRFPNHAGAHFALSRLLMEEDDERFVEHLEAAMANGSEFIAPSLQLLLEHYRASGRDREAEPIRQRIVRHESALLAARKERLRLGRRDKLLPHDLKDEDVEQVRRVLFRYPQVLSAHLARKEVRLFSDKPCYVLAITRRSGPLEDRRQRDKYLVGSIAAEMPVDCAVVILGWRSGSIRRRLLRACAAPVFQPMR